MPTELAAVLITAAVSIGGSWIVARQASWRYPLDQLQTAWQRIDALEGRVEDLEGKRQADALTKRAMGDHIDILEHHIWQQKPPPPPPRPPGV